MGNYADIRIGKLNKAALVAVALFLFASSFFLLGGEPWAAGYINLSERGSILLGLLSFVVLLFSTYIVSAPMLPRPSERTTALLFAAAIHFINPNALYFSPIYPTSIALLWAHYCLLNRQLFTGFFLIAVASMFYPPIIWTTPFAALLLLAGEQDALRSIIKFLGGLLVPFILLLSVQYLLDRDVMGYLSRFLSRITTISITLTSKDLAYLFMLLCLTVVVANAMFTLLNNFKTKGIADAYFLKTECIYVFLTFALFLLFGSNETMPLSVLVGCPAGILLSRYFSDFGNKLLARVEIVLLLVALVVARLGYFIV